MSFSLDDQRFMDAALAQGYTGLGHTSPNPSVGCVIVKDRKVLAGAVTGKGGRPHAETQALEIAGEEAAGSTCYVTLEPCSHHGQTPPCADELIKAGVVRVVIAVEDPFSEVNGNGIARLKAAGITVETGLRREQAEAQHAGFFSRLRTGRPIVAKDQRPDLFDCDLKCEPPDSEEETLARLGQSGITRVRRAE